MFVELDIFCLLLDKGLCTFAELLFSGVHQFLLYYLAARSARNEHQRDEEEDQGIHIELEKGNPSEDVHEDEQEEQNRKHHYEPDGLDKLEVAVCESQRVVRLIVPE